MARSSTTFRPKWKLGNTTVIRVPHALAAAVLQYAHDLDENAEPLELKEPAVAYRTAEDVEMTQPVNVASVPKRSPFRYPGGKTWLVPYTRSWLAQKPNPVECYMNNEKLAELRSLQAKADALRQDLVLSQPGQIIYRAALDVTSDDTVVVKADGFGGATTRVVQGNYPVDYAIKFEEFFATEGEAETAAEELVSNERTARQVLAAATE